MITLPRKNSEPKAKESLGKYHLQLHACKQTKRVIGHIPRKQPDPKAKESLGAKSNSRAYTPSFYSCALKPLQLRRCCQCHEVRKTVSKE